MAEPAGRRGDYAFEKELHARLRTLSGPAPEGFARWTPRLIANLALVTGVLVIAATLLPNRFFDPTFTEVSVVIGTLGVWRFGWWFNHWIRSETYARRRWPKMRLEADRLWLSGWRPRHLHIQMTTYFEEPAITRLVIGSILTQVRQEQIPTTLWIGTGAAYDEQVIRDFVEVHGADLDMDLVFLRQNQPGKRMAIGLIVRGIARYLTHPDDLVIFMDGDAAFGPGVLRKSLSMFGADPELQALTTNEDVVCFGPGWMQSWLSLRFAQRRLAMQSHALSNKVLTLTGRMSVFRAKHIMDEGFVRTIEADYLDHWLWGRFRFLSGDDKSTWYHLLTKGAKMIYVPDAMVYTVEVVKGSGMERMVQNFRRWSGNMLRNGARAIALGPRKVGPFIWWCLIDQRLAMWTMMVAPVLAILTLATDPYYMANVILWLAASRVVLCLVLWRYARQPDLWWPLILYGNQIINAAVKIFMLFHLSKQRWANRGNQTSGEALGGVAMVKSGVAKFQMTTALVTFLTGVAILAGLLPSPF
jgi:glycosyltransferase Alg8